MTTKQIKARLEYLRGQLRAERISWGELAELQGLASHIEPGDVELLEAAGVPERHEMPQKMKRFVIPALFVIDAMTQADAESIAGNLQAVANRHLLASARERLLMDEKLPIKQIPIGRELPHSYKDTRDVDLD
jgi:hypothetical protein